MEKRYQEADQTGVKPEKVQFSLLYKVNGVVFLCLLIFGILSGIVIQMKMNDALRHEYISKGESIAQGFATSSVELLIDRDAASIQSFLDDYIEIRGVAYVYILNQDGEVIAHTFVPSFPEKIIQKNPLPANTSMSVKEIEVEGFSWIIDIGVPILWGTLGEVHVGMDKGIINQQVLSAQIFNSFISLIGMVISLGIASLLSLQIIKPIKHLTRSTTDIARGDFSSFTPIHTRDETGVLGKAFLNMAEQLRRSNEEVHRKNLELERQYQDLVATTEELKQTQKQLIQSEKFASMGQLAASVAHEINNPLAGILVFIRLMIKKLKKGQTDPEVIKMYLNNLQIMGAETQRCGNIVKNLLNFARATEPHYAQVDLTKVLEDTLSLTAHKAQMSEIEIHKDLKELPGIVADPSQLKQVFLNIIINAIEAMQRDEKILTINSYCSDENRRVFVEISDTGIGIGEENLPKLFDPFFTTKEKGTGLGLSVVYGLVNNHGGEVTIESEKGKGTTVTVSLPVSPQPEV